MSRPEPYVNGSGHPPGHGYQPYHDARGYSDDGYGRPPQRSPDKQQPYFDPPPREPHPERPEHPESVDDRYYSYEQPGHEYTDYGPPPGPERPYAPNEPHPHEYNEMTPYDDEKAEAEWRRGVESAYTYQRPPPPPQDPEYLRRRALEEEARDREIERERAFERQRRDDEDRYYEERDRERERERERERRRRREEDSVREKVLRYPSDPKKGGRDVFGGSEGERGLGAKIAGGAGGALLGHELSDNVLGTLGGAVVGAVAANVFEKHHEKRQTAKMAKRASRDGAYPVRSGSLDYPRSRSYRERDRYDDRHDDRYDDRYERGRERSVSRGTGLKDRIMRSLSRARSKSAPRRRSPSFDSEYSHRR
ncbi:hypothetical protein PRZ48_003936 [Zasmidium cellare]|uniref:Glycine zipper 2TM domain-containing protein n=1 Tax=Zasmidium cellare TaxID=395010 RepID=A0ABR0EY09_ZASCE|nr:hypothetical protein PRZ48_003936 [Zasmidium cellare]